MAEFNVVGPRFDPENDILLFTSIEEDQAGIIPDVIHLEESDKSMAHLLARIGKFGSVGEARRNGWDKPIPTGWNEFSVGKGKNRVDLFLWNPTHSLAATGI